MKLRNKRTVIFAILGALGIILMLVGSFLPSFAKDDEKSSLESRFEEAILKLSGISEADVIIQKSGDEITGAVAVCKGGTDAEREVITRLLCSGLDLPSNRIYVVCN